MDKRIEIQLSKSKLLALLIGSIVFVVLGILLVLNPEQFRSTFFSNPQTIRLAGLAGIVFFGLCLLFIAKKLFDKKIGLAIDDAGITDNSSATSVGLIEWADITDIATVKVASTEILMLYTVQPEKYISRAKNAISKRAMKSNYKMYGSPIAIISNSLKINHEELENLIRTAFQKHTNRNK